MTALLDRRATHRVAAPASEPIFFLGAPGPSHRRVGSDPAGHGLGRAPSGPAPARLRPARMAPPRIWTRSTAPAPAGRRPLRLTRRARLLRSAAVLLLLVAVALTAAGNSPGSAATPPPPAQIVVAPGDTLWDLAAELAPGQDPARVAWLLSRANGLDSAVLQPGQVLRVPAPIG